MHTNSQGFSHSMHVLLWLPDSDVMAPGSYDLALCVGIVGARGSTVGVDRLPEQTPKSYSLARDIAPSTCQR